MEKMVGLFTVVVEGHIEYSNRVDAQYVKSRVRKMLERRVAQSLKTGGLSMEELDADDSTLWSFTPMSSDLEEGGTIVRRLSDAIRPAPIGGADGQSSVRS